MKYNFFLASFVLSFVLLSVLSSCANMASPNGGPYDEKPPQLVSSTPSLNQTNFSGKRIEIVFDELVQLEKPSENVIITPPQKKLPEIRPAGKKIVVELKDSLIPNMTYTIDFTNSISDNNEKNVLENFSLAFSTGEIVDSLEVSGTVLDAKNLEPMPGILIGLHHDLADSAFTTKPFFRTSKTNDRGQFTIRNIASGKYRIYALNDKNRDYFFDQPGEDIAFLDSIIEPTFELATKLDTIWKDTATIDTVYTVEYTRFLPDNIVLRLFKEDFQRQYMLRPERIQDKLFALRFNAPLIEYPELQLIEYPEKKDWYIYQQGNESNSVNCWITDSMVWQKDTLHLQITYQKTDSLNQLYNQVDSIHLSVRKQPSKAKKKKKDEPDPIIFLGMEASASSSMNVFDTISFTFSEPLYEFPIEAIQLEQKLDTLWHKVDFKLVPDSINLLKYYIERNWKYGEEYQIIIDSAMIFSIYGKWNDLYETTFKFRPKDEYGHLYLNIQGVSGSAFVELLNGSDVPIRKARVEEGGVLFLNLKPEKYYARLILDSNENGEWDTGCYSENRQPEEVFYSSEFYEIRANWEIEETWEVFSEPLIKQKPLEITKNKPKDDNNKKRNYKEEGKQQQSTPTSNMPGAGRLGF